jgi:NitT/TauT family transport system substrate-binding protein
MRTRRAVLKSVAAIAGAAAAMPAIIRPSQAGEPITVVTPLGFVVDFLDTMNAYSGGHFARQGLDVKVLGAINGVQMLQLVVSGRAAFGRGGSPDVVRAFAAHQQVPIAISSIAQGCTFRVYSLKAKPIREPKDFRGKTIGLITLASATGVYLDVMLAKSGIKPDEVERQATGGTPGAFEILKQGRVDCFIGSHSVQVALERAGAPVEVWNPRPYLPLPGQCYYALPGTLAANPDDAVRLLRAHKASMDEIFTGPIAPILKRAAKDFDIPGMADIDLLVAMIAADMEDRALDPARKDLMVNLPALWQDGCDALRSAGIADIADPRVLYTNRFVDAALKT